MKRSLLAIFAIALAGNAFAADVTPNLGLVKPPAIAGTWADDINDNFDKIDAAFTEDGLIDTFTQTEADGIDFLVGTATGSLAAERVCTTTATIACDKATAGQIKWNVVGNSIGPTQIDETLDYAWTGKHTFTQLVLVPVTVAALPAAPSDGQLAIVSDALTVSNCEVGGGGFQNLCKRNASSGHWEAIGTLGGGTTPTLQQVADVGREINNAVDDSTCLKVWNGINGWCIGADSSNEAFIRTIQAGDWVIRLTAGNLFKIYDSAGALLATIDEATGDVVLATLITTGAATGKTVVCADANGKLYRSSTGIDCSN